MGEWDFVEALPKSFLYYNFTGQNQKPNCLCWMAYADAIVEKEQPTLQRET